MTIGLESPPDRKTLDVIAEGLQAYNSTFGLGGFDEFTVPLVAENGDIKGGVALGALFIPLFWIEEPYRRKGYGRALMAAAEAEGRRRGCELVWLDTYEFQARPFYEKLGFRVFGTLDYPAGVQRFFMQKAL
jgi:GNAT superfamily N-acetyltransferase